MIFKFGFFGYVNDCEVLFFNFFILDCIGYFVFVFEVLFIVVFDCCVFEIVMDIRGGGVVVGLMWIGIEIVVVDVGWSIILVFWIFGVKMMVF